MISLPISGEELLLLIPQRAPIVMVSTLESYDDKRLVSTFVVCEENIFVNEVTLVESGLLEHMAQSVALHTGYSYFLKGENAPMGYIGSMQDVDIQDLPEIKVLSFNYLQLLYL